jgi:hypothetical protein
VESVDLRTAPGCERDVKPTMDRFPGASMKNEGRPPPFLPKPAAAPENSNRDGRAAQYWIVQKLGHSGELAKEADPRSDEDSPASST